MLNYLNKPEWGFGVNLKLRKIVKKKSYLTYCILINGCKKFRIKKVENMRSIIKGNIFNDASLE